ncbi:MAG: NAD(P)-binding domain-containing protein, partial [Hyphomonadaceae bacterium]|nr:NAD(P)-binding domain-containing protein [Hyphomonadaceae bacterium]
MRALMIGCGKMGGALLSQWAGEPSVSFTIIDPVADVSLKGVRLERSSAEISGETFDMLVVAIKPQQIADILPEYVKHLADGALVVSMAAGCSSDSLERALGTQAIVRIMPNMPSAIG